MDKTAAEEGGSIAEIGVVGFLKENGKGGMEHVVRHIFGSPVAFYEALADEELADFLMRDWSEEASGNIVLNLWRLLEFRHREDLEVYPYKLISLLLSFCRHTCEDYPEIDAAALLRAYCLDDEPWGKNAVFIRDDKDERLIEEFVSCLLREGKKTEARICFLVLAGLPTHDFRNYLDHNGGSNGEIAEEIDKKAVLAGPEELVVKLIEAWPERHRRE